MTATDAVRVQDGRTEQATTLRTPWWLVEALEYEGGATPSVLVGDVRADVVVVGGGFTGLWTAITIRQRRPDAVVVVLEADLVGSGPSGMNGGFVSGYWHYIPGLTRTFGAETAWEIGEAGGAAQRAILELIESSGGDVWLSQTDTLKVATSEQHEQQLRKHLSAMAEAGLGDKFEFLDYNQVQERCAASTFRCGALYKESATVQPARLVRLLRQEAIKLGVKVFENTRADSIDGHGPHTIRTRSGSVTCDQVVLATNASLAEERHLRGLLTTLSSYVVLTEPIPERLASMNWDIGTGIVDTRIFVRYFRPTKDGRIAFGTSEGPIGRTGRPAINDVSMINRVISSFQRLLPELASVRFERAWAGPIDMASDQIPFFGQLPREGSVFYGTGFSGHGVNAAWIGGQCLASLALGTDDRWTRSVFCTRRPPTLPPDPLTWAAGTVIKKAVLRVDAAHDAAAKPPIWARFVADIPRLLRMRIGVRD